MKLFALLAAINPTITPEVCKVYLHQPVRDGSGDWLKPLDMWRDGSFDDFQRVQKIGHFSAPFLVSLIRNEHGGYMFAGVFRVAGYTKQDDGWLTYDLERLADFDELNGRLHVKCSDKGGQSPCFTGAYMADRLAVQAITEHRHGAAEFPGYRHVRLRKADLDRLIEAEDARWKGPLSAVKGIYLISDPATTSLYVGLASGQAGFWGRWCCYARTGHGGNAKMIRLLDELSGGHAENFVFSILEIADLNTSDEALVERESHWKELLHSRVSLNAN